MDLWFICLMAAGNFGTGLVKLWKGDIPFGIMFISYGVSTLCYLWLPK